MRRYHITNRDDYKKLNQVSGMVTKFVNTLKKLDPKDSTRIELTDKILDKYVFEGYMPLSVMIPLRAVTVYLCCLSK